MGPCPITSIYLANGDTNRLSSQSHQEMLKYRHCTIKLAITNALNIYVDWMCIMQSYHLSKGFH